MGCGTDQLEVATEISKRELVQIEGNKKGILEAGDGVPALE